jgi:uncharacterized protein with beta-barrel porin domain
MCTPGAKLASSMGTVTTTSAALTSSMPSMSREFHCWEPEIALNVCGNGRHAALHARLDPVLVCCCDLVHIV